MESYFEFIQKLENTPIASKYVKNFNSNNLILIENFNKIVVYKFNGVLREIQTFVVKNSNNIITYNIKNRYFLMTFGDIIGVYEWNGFKYDYFNHIENNCKVEKVNLVYYHEIPFVFALLYVSYFLNLNVHINLLNFLG